MGPHNPMNSKIHPEEIHLKPFLQE